MSGLKNSIVNRRDKALVEYHKSIEWLREICLYKKNFELDEGWTSDPEMHKWLKKDSQKAFREAFYVVRNNRELVDKLSEKLMDLNRRNSGR